MIRRPLLEQVPAPAAAALAFAAFAVVSSLFSLL